MFLTSRPFIASLLIWYPISVDILWHRYLSGTQSVSSFEFLYEAALFSVQSFSNVQNLRGFCGGFLNALGLTGKNCRLLTATTNNLLLFYASLLEAFSRRSQWRLNYLQSTTFIFPVAFVYHFICHWTKKLSSNYLHFWETTNLEHGASHNL